MRHPAWCVAVALLAASAPCGAQSRLSEHGVVAQTVGNTTVTVEYYRPVARGRTPVFGDGGIVPWGELWTPGANWAATLDVDRDVRVEGALLPKGRYSLWTVPRREAWTVELHRGARRFHLARPDSSDLALRTVVRPDSGPHTEVLTFDFPDVATGATTLRLRWGTLVVPMHLGMIAPPLRLLASREARARYVGRYDVELFPVMGMPGGRLVVDVADVADTLRWRDVERSAGAKRDLVLVPAGPDDQFLRARRAADGQYWTESGLTTTFTMSNGRAASFEVQIDDGTVVSRGTRRRSQSP